MTVWRPSPVLRVKVLGLAWRGGQLLVSEVEDSSGRVTGVRPLGGSIEFGETREQALVREFEEELGCTATIAGPWHCVENIFEHEGRTGHEFVFAANVRLSDRALLEQDRFRFLESDEAACWASWTSPDTLPPGVALYPLGLSQLIRDGVVGPER